MRGRETVDEAVDDLIRCTVVIKDCESVLVLCHGEDHVLPVQGVEPKVGRRPDRVGVQGGSGDPAALELGLIGEFEELPNPLPAVVVRGRLGRRGEPASLRNDIDVVQNRPTLIIWSRS